MTNQQEFEPVYIGQPPTCDPETIAMLAQITGQEPQHGGKILRFRFENDYGASVVTHFGSYGAVDQWELAVIHYKNGEVTDDGDSELVYDTPVADDVIGYLDWDEVEELLVQIKALPERSAPDNLIKVEF